MPLFRLEHDYIPSVQRIVDAVQVALAGLRRPNLHEHIQASGFGRGLGRGRDLEWHVKVGDHVRVDQPMVSVETAKAVVEVPAPFSGIVTALHGARRRHRADRRAAHRVRFRHRRRQHARRPARRSSSSRAVSRRAARATAPPRSRAVPVARALAKRLGLDSRRLEGSGRGG